MNDVRFNFTGVERMHNSKELRVKMYDTLKKQHISTTFHCEAFTQKDYNLWIAKSIWVCLDGLTSQGVSKREIEE